MGKFHCDKCGHYWSDTSNFTVCPICTGMGKRDEKCTCAYWAGPMGQKTNVIRARDPSCPIHRDKED